MDFYRIFDVPALYNLQQRIFASGADSQIIGMTERILRAGPPSSGPILDVGCGPRSWLEKHGLHPVGLDVNLHYMRAYSANNPIALVASGGAMPFPDGTFDSVWSIGVLHHLDDALALDTLREAVRVCRPGGYVAILDAVKPDRIVDRPLAALLRRCDRGRFMRYERELRSLLDRVHVWDCNRVTYARTGLEMLVSTAHKRE